MFFSWFLVPGLDESVLRDLRALLMEAKQKVPPFLEQLEDLSSDLLGLGGTVVAPSTYNSASSVSTGQNDSKPQSPLLLNLFDDHSVSMEFNNCISV